MNGMLERLEDAQVRQRRFVSDASHELRSPVASIRQHAEVALAHPEQADLVDLAVTVLAEDLRIQRLVEDLLLLAAADERPVARRFRPVDLDDLVLAAVRDVRAVSSLRVDATAVSAARVSGDPTALRRMLRNITDNAVRHARSRVAFAVGEVDGAAVVVVDDDGAGIPAVDRERFLQRFVRLDDARARDAGGSGLGLAIVAEIAAAHGGRVAVGRSALGGARIAVTLPRCDDAPP
jgi:signal transduction histidine kinase